MSERFIIFTRTNDQGGNSEDEIPSLVINPRAIAYMSASEENGSVCIRLTSGEEYLISGMESDRLRSVFRDLLRGLGDGNEVAVPAKTHFSQIRNLH